MNQGGVGSLIRETRRRLGLTQEQLADGICDPATVSRIENGEAGTKTPTCCRLMERLGLDPMEAEASADPAFLMAARLKRRILEALRAQQLTAAERLLTRYMRDGGAFTGQRDLFLDSSLLILEGLWMDPLREADPDGWKQWNSEVLERTAETLSGDLERKDGIPAETPPGGSEGGYPGEKRPGDSEDGIPAEAAGWIARHSAFAAARTREELFLWNAMAASLLALGDAASAARIWTALLQHCRTPRAHDGKSTDRRTAEDISWPPAVNGRIAKAALCANLSLACAKLGQRSFTEEYSLRALHLLQGSDPLNLWMQALAIRAAVTQKELNGGGPPVIRVF